MHLRTIMNPRPNPFSPNAALGPIVAICKTIRVDVDLGLAATAAAVLVPGNGFLLAPDGVGVVGKPAGPVPDAT